MKYAANARELLLELKRNPEAPYNDALIKTIMDEFNLHVQALNEQIKVGTDNDTQNLSQTSKPSVLLESAAIERNKRALLTYHWVRMQNIQSQFWKNSSILPKGLSPSERDFAEAYAQLIQDYTTATVPWDDLNIVPKDKIQVRVLENMGELVLESGTSVNLLPHSIHYLNFSDVYQFVREGKMQVLEAEQR